MNSKHTTPRRFATMLAGLVLLAVSTAAGAQEAKGGTALTLLVEPGKRSYQLGEPVYVTVRLRNGAAQAQRLRTMLNPSAGMLTMLVDGPGDGRPKTFVPLAIGDYELPETELMKDREMNATFQIFFGGNGWTFPETGSYQLTAVLERPGGAATRSAPATITVTRGDGAGTYLFGRPIEDRYETGKFLVWLQGDHLRRAQATLQEIIERYPDSPLATHARLATGVSLSKSFRDYSIGRVRAAQPERALELLNAVPAEALPNLLKLQRQLAIARSYAILSRSQEAEAAWSAAQELAADDSRALAEPLTAETSYDPVLGKLATRQK